MIQRGFGGFTSLQSFGDTCTCCDMPKRRKKHESNPSSRVICSRVNKSTSKRAARLVIGPLAVAKVLRASVIPFGQEIILIDKPQQLSCKKLTTKHKNVSRNHKFLFHPNYGFQTSVALLTCEGTLI